MAVGSRARFGIYWLRFLLSANKMDTDGDAMAYGRFCNLYAVFQEIKEANV